MLEHLISSHPYSVTKDLIIYARDLDQRDISDYLTTVAKLNEELSAEISDKNLSNFKKLCEEKGAKPKSATSNLVEFAALNGAIDIFEYLVSEHNFTEFDLEFLAAESLYINDPKLLELLLLKHDFNPEIPNRNSKHKSLYEFSKSDFKNDASQYLENLRSVNEGFSRAVQDNDHELATEILAGKMVLKSRIKDAALQSCANGNLEIYLIVSQNSKFDKSALDKDGNSIFF